MLGEEREASAICFGFQCEFGLIEWLTHVVAVILKPVTKPPDDSRETFWAIVRSYPPSSQSLSCSKRGTSSREAVHHVIPASSAYRRSSNRSFPMRSYGYIHGHPHGHVYGHPHGYAHGHPHGDAHQIEGKQARRFMYMNRARSLPRPTALKQQPECRRPMEEEKE